MSGRLLTGLVIGFVAGGVFGFFVAAVMSVAARESEKERDADVALERARVEWAESMEPMDPRIANAPPERIAAIYRGIKHGFPDEHVRPMGATPNRKRGILS